MIGAVQILALGYKQTELPEEIIHEINLLRSNDAVRLLDVYAINKAANRTMTEHGIEEIKDWDGALIRGLLRTAGPAGFSTLTRQIPPVSSCRAPPSLI
ncbi:hypothetical protein [Micromonospora marina]|uniref:hypothetical protein n=1 Tax=Micromonospora marina TaxID=307120 RepID=UPI003D763015